MNRQAADVTLSRRRLSDVLLTVPAFRTGMGENIIGAFDAFLDALRGPTDQTRRGLILAEVKQAEPTTYGYAYTLAHLPRARRVYLDKRLHAKALSSFEVAFTRAATDAGGRRIALMLIERTPRSYAAVVDIAVMLTGRTYFPPTPPISLHHASRHAKARDRAAENRLGGEMSLASVPVGGDHLPTARLCDGCRLPQVSRVSAKTIIASR